MRGLIEVTVALIIALPVIMVVVGIGGHGCGHNCCCVIGGWWWWWLQLVDCGSHNLMTLITNPGIFFVGHMALNIK